MTGIPYMISRISDNFFRISMSLLRHPHFFDPSKPYKTDLTSIEADYICIYRFVLSMKTALDGESSRMRAKSVFVCTGILGK